jgi:polysaccharide deacetylase 2 family uncharacterized protein YibQ
MAKKSKGGGGGFARLLWLVLFVALGFFGWKYSRTGALLDESERCGRLEESVNEALVRCGVGDSDIVKTLRTERRKKLPLPTLWIETEREVRLRAGLPVEKIVGEIEKISGAAQLSFWAGDPGSDPRTVEVGKSGRIYQRLVFSSNALRRADRKGTGKGGRVAIVIDDIAGRPTDLAKLDEFLALGIPVTYAVLPRERLTRAVSEKIHRAGDEIIVHQPMEPEDLAHNNPGKAALLNRMSASEIEGKVRDCFKNVPHAVGLSNHMGSHFTADARVMEPLLKAVKGMKTAGGAPVFFFDSHTAQKPVAEDLARSLGVGHLRNDLFLDNKDDEKAMLEQIESLRHQVRSKGWGIAIGHIQRRHMTGALKRAIADFHREGIQFVHLSDLLSPAPASSRRKKS